MRAEEPAFSRTALLPEALSLISGVAARWASRCGQRRYRQSEPRSRCRRELRAVRAGLGANNQIGRCRGLAGWAMMGSLNFLRPFDEARNDAPALSIC
jgi:hypothetical protein